MRSQLISWSSLLLLLSSIITATSSTSDDLLQHTATRVSSTTTLSPIKETNKPAKIKRRLQTCQKGSKVSSNGIACVTCPHGTYQDLASHSEEDCKNCPLGWQIFISNPSDDTAGEHEECNTCPSGTEWDSSATACKVCGAGLRNIIDPADANSRESKCEECPAARHSTLDSVPANHVECLQCPKGYFYESNIECKDCPQGYQQSIDVDAAGQDIVPRVCKRCELGKWASEAYSNCAGCSVGKYQDLDEADQPSIVQVCKDCVNGQYAEQGSQAACKNCLEGKYNSGVGHTLHDNENDCKDCDIGKFSLQGAEECSMCVHGKAPGKKAGTDIDICIECVPGKYNNEEGANACKECDAGQFSEDKGQMICYPCSSGEYQSEDGKIKCLECPLGWSQNNRGAIECTACAAGLSTTSKRAKSCENCLPGKSSASSGAICTHCLAGKFSDTAGSSICKYCPKGKWSDTVGRETCTNCAVGKMNDEIGRTTMCTSCPAGWKAPQGSTICNPCAAGKSSKEGSAQNCDLCPMGQYTSSTGAICVACPLGRHQLGVGKDVCEECPEGFTSTDGKLDLLPERTKQTTARVACIPPSYELASTCSVENEYLDDCDEFGGDCDKNLDLIVDDETRQKRKCLQCEPGMICDENSALSKRNMYRKAGWYYLDSNFTVRMEDVGMKYDTEKIAHTYYVNPKRNMDIRYWVEGGNSDDDGDKKSKYDSKNFSALECPFKSRCCGARIPVTKSVLDEDTGTWREDGITIPDEEETCAQMNYSGIFGVEKVKYGCQEITNNATNDNEEETCKYYDRIKYPFWNITCAAGVDMRYPLCAVCLAEYESVGSAKRCVKCTPEKTVLRLIVVSSIIALFGVILLIAVTNQKCRRWCKVHTFKSARGDIGRMVRLLIDFFQIVLSMEQIMPNLPWPTVFIDHMSGLNFVDFNLLEIFGIRCSIGVDFINSMFFYFSIPIIAIIWLGLNILVNRQYLQFIMNRARNKGKLEQMWIDAVGDMFEYVLEPNKDAENDESAPTHVVSEHSLSDLLRISNAKGRVVTDSKREAHRMIQRFSANQGYLTRDEFIQAFNSIMEDRRRKSIGAKASSAQMKNMHLQQYNLIYWTRWQKLWSLVLERTFVVLLLAHAPICKVAFRVYRCTQVGDQRYLSADFGVNCGTPLAPNARYDLAWYLSVAMLSLYTLGFPIMLGIYLFLNRNLLYTFRIKMQIGWLFLHYKRGLEFWTLWEIALKIYLMGFLYSIDESTRPYFGAVVSCFALTMVATLEPQRNQIVANLAVVKWFATSILYLSATQLDETNTEQNGSIMLALMIIVDSCFVIGMSMIGYRLYQAMQKESGGHATFKLKSAVGKIRFSMKLAMLKPPADPEIGDDSDLALFLPDETETTLGGGKSKVAVYPMGTDATDMEESKEGSMEQQSSTASVDRSKDFWATDGEDSVNSGSTGSTTSSTSSTDTVTQQSETSTNSVEAEYSQQVAPSAAPREIGGGWWETYDPNHQRFFYSNVDGKPTTWVWPDEVERETGMHNFATNIVKDVRTQNLAHRVHHKLRSGRTTREARKRGTENAVEM